MDTQHHQLRAVGVTLDSNDPDQTANFWQAALGFRRREGDGNPYITPDGPAGRPLNHLTIQRVPEGKTAKHRLHIDLFVSDDAESVAALVELGATVSFPQKALATWVCEQRSWPTRWRRVLCGLPGLALQLSQELGSCIFKGSKIPEYFEWLLRFFSREHT